MKFLVDFIILGIIYFVKFFNKWKKQDRDVFLVKTLMYIYLSFVLYFTLMPIITSIPNRIINHSFFNINFEAFIDVSLGRGDFLKQIILNIIMTIPFGIMFPIILKMNNKNKKIFSTTMLKGLAFIICIEILQPIISDFRSFDITDIITNLTGCCIGYIIYKIFNKPIYKVLNVIKKK